MRSKILLLGLLVLAAGCDSGSGDPEVLGAVEERGGLGVAVSAGMEGLPVPREVTPTVAETSTAKAFRLPSSVSVDDANAWFSTHLPEGRSFENWAWCGKRQDSLGVTWRWYRTDDPDLGTLSVEMGRDDRTGVGYVLTAIRADHDPRICNPG